MKTKTPSKLPTLTIADIRSWSPCYDPKKYAAESWKGTIVHILKAKKVPAQDRLWCALRPEVGIDDKTLRLFACWCAREALKLVPEKELDPRSVKAIEVSEQFAHGKATESELAAARAAARDAAWAAARDAARDAAGDAAGDAARDAAWAAARDAAGDAQLAKLISML